MEPCVQSLPRSVALAVVLAVLLLPAIAAADDAQAEGTRSRSPVEYSSVFEGIPGRGNMTLWNLSIPQDGLYQVRWEADVFASPPVASRGGTCAVGDDPGREFLYDAAAYSLVPSVGSAVGRYLRQHVGGTFVAHFGAGTTLALRCSPSGSTGAAAEAESERLFGAALLARRLE